MKKRKVFNSRNPTRFYLIECDNCMVRRWYAGKKCKNGKRKYCSYSCISSGKPHTNEWKEKLSIKNTGENNPFYCKHHTIETIDKIKLTADSWNKTKNTLSPEEYKKWYNDYCFNLSGTNNHFYGKKHSIESRQKMSNIRSQMIADGYIDLQPSHYGLKGNYFSSKMNETFRYDSLIEYLRMKMLDLDNSVLSWTKKHGLRIKYELEGNIKSYVPDFLITYSDRIVLEELKGYEENEIKKQAKFDILKRYCIKNNLVANILSYEDIDVLCKKIFGKRINVLRKEYKEGKK